MDMPVLDAILPPRKTLNQKGTVFGFL